MKNHSDSSTASPVTDATLGLFQEIMRQRRKGELSDEQLLALTEGRNPFDLHWYDAIVRRCQSQLSTALRRPVKVPPPPDSVTPALAEKLAKFGMVLVWFPEINIHVNFRVKGGQWVKPEKWFYDNLQDQNGMTKIGPAATWIEAGWYAIDITPAVDKNDSFRVFPNDPLATLITQKIGSRKVASSESRFAISPVEWDRIIAPSLASELCLQSNQATVRLERAIEFNLIGNVYDKARGKFNTSQWFAEPLADAGYHLLGGNRDQGGLAHVDCETTFLRLNLVAGRCLVHFS